MPEDLSVVEPSREAGPDGVRTEGAATAKARSRTLGEPASIVQKERAAEPDDSPLILSLRQQDRHHASLRNCATSVDSASADVLAVPHEITSRTRSK